MLQVQAKKILKPLTTFKIGGPATVYLEIREAEQIAEAFALAEHLQLPTLVLGGGSNLLVSDRGFDGVVLHVALRGLEIVAETAEKALLSVGSGEVWDDVVKFAVERNLWGIENLSRIPGQTGALAVQNVGAYGAEASQVIKSVTAFDRKTNTIVDLAKEECKFAYRTSIFNTTHKARYVILETYLELSKHPKPLLDYPDLRSRFSAKPNVTISEIRKAIIEIRDTKFPFPAESVEGNAGSFFKNSLLTEASYLGLVQKFTEGLPEHLEKLQSIRHRFPERSGIKIPSAFIFEACGLKGFRRGDVMLNPSQPVVVLNVTGTASATEVLALVAEVRAIVKAKTGLHLFAEPELIGFTKQELTAAGFNDLEIERYLGH
ncbi:MAG: UDP-N-acetylmuramate dehydrogenase [Candidatus Kapaibacterium sp.]|jgi:UDP-N-acetylmuramate dehydrogenase